jgi:hypothetical protein
MHKPNISLWEENGLCYNDIQIMHDIERLCVLRHAPDYRLQVIEKNEVEGNMKKILVTAFVILALFSVAVSAQENIEKKKIEFLLSSVENLKGAVFIRNGSEYDDGKAAAAHLRMKLKNAGGRVQTADDFIRLCASQSFLTGKPYMIRLPNGKTIKSEEYFREKLKEYYLTVK